WFNKHHLREDVILPKNTTQEREFVNSMYVKHLLYLRTKILEYE
ncbi:4247_t:CDS:1, partial [Funneliformis caledonium]